MMTILTRACAFDPQRRAGCGYAKRIRRRLAGLICQPLRPDIANIQTAAAIDIWFQMG